MNIHARLLPCSLLALALAACSPAPQPAGEALDPPASGAEAVAVEQAGIAIQAPWVRQPPPSAQVAAGYLRIDNPGPDADRLVAVETDAAGHVEIHEMEEVDGVMRMREMADGLEVPAGGHVELVPGGYHLMLMEPREGMEAGQQVEATLVFEVAGGVPVTFDVRPTGSTGGAGDGHDHGH